MEFAQLVFSGPGAAIFVCVTILTIVLLYLAFPHRFWGVKVEYRDIKVETPSTIPSAQPELSAQSIEITEQAASRPASLDNKSTLGSADLDNNATTLKDLFDAVARRDRRGIEEAAEKLKTNPPFGFNDRQLEIFRLGQLLTAGFLDAVPKLSELEQRTGDIQASTHLASHYIQMRSWELAKKHLQIAAARVTSDQEKANVALIEADLIEMTAGAVATANFLSERALNIGNHADKAELLKRAGELYKSSNNDIRAILAYEEVLRSVPEDSATRFKLALTYCAISGLKLLGYRHYQIILAQNMKNSPALNNIALLYGEFGLPLERERILKLAKVEKDAHAIANLASYYLDAGFADEATALLDTLPPEASSNGRALTVRQSVASSNHIVVPNAKS